MIEHEPNPGLIERILSVTKNFVVIVTCLAILYTLWRVYGAMAEFGAELQRLGR